MLTGMDNKPMHYWLWLLPLAAFVGGFLPLLLVNGLPDTDGLVYASIARNLAAGHGSFWQPYFTEYHLPQFYDHPALAISWQAWAYKVFGDHDAIEKIYSFIITALNWLLLYALAKRFMPYLRWYKAWVLLLAWLVVPVNPWAYASNMLEPVANIFGLIALYLIIVSYQQQQRGSKLLASLLVAGVSTCIGVYVNGPLVLFVWLVEPCLWLLYQQERSAWSCYRWLVLVVVTVVAFLAFIPAHQNFIHYWHQQVLASLQNKRLNSKFFGLDRFAIVYTTLVMLLPNFILAGLSYLFATPKPIRVAKQHAVFFLLLFLISVLPIMLSSKQFYHYALQGYPFMQMVLALLLLPAIFAKLAEWFARPVLAKVFKVILVLIVLLSFAWMIVFLMHQDSLFNRNYTEARGIIKVVGHNKVIALSHTRLVNPAEFEIYLQRYGQINLRPEKNAHSEYWMTVAPLLLKRKPPAGYHLEKFTSGYENARLYKKQ